MAFIKRIEDFTCEHCATQVQGTGYTNHCPRCLWSKHVDVDPGDRAAVCGGLMEPVSLEGSSPEYVIVHRCVRCNHMKRNSVAPNDSDAALLDVARRRDA